MLKKQFVRQLWRPFSFKR
ncbi:Protein of unknown function [Bacillus cytotoxicus]|uniref:Uncharacterized protein n=1 Tax=Bacillus cytotoxicus TaxID=580165 RepID=A0AAX2CCJ9_9BACI|nr:Protein of unknown function [Bacillus cytotoxicus]SCN30632.1 Protein of unknown function [Bacillus cytotoxicus]